MLTTQIALTQKKSFLTENYLCMSKHRFVKTVSLIIQKLETSLVLLNAGAQVEITVNRNNVGKIQLSMQLSRLYIIFENICI